MKFLREQNKPLDEVEGWFEQETEELSVSRFRFAVLCLVLLLPTLVLIDFVTRTAAATESLVRVFFIGEFLLFFFLSMTFVPQFKRSCYAFTFFLSIVIGTYNIVMILLSSQTPTDHMAVLMLYFALISFLMPWGGSAVGALFFPVYLFYPLGLVLYQGPISQDFVMKSNIYIILFMGVAILASEIAERNRFQEFVIRKRAEGENTTLQDYQVRLQRAYERMEHLAKIDHLTDVFNRSHLTDWLMNGVYKDKDAREIFSLIMFDIDKFKLINDMAGHQVGDRIIRSVADLTKEHTYAKAKVFRYGGDEFCVVLPGLGLKEAIRIAENVRATIEHDKGLFVRLSSMESIHVTLSLGVTAQYVSGSIDSDFLIRWVDAALLESKRKGRNCIHVFDPQTRQISPAEDWMKSESGDGASPAS